MARRWRVRIRLSRAVWPAMQVLLTGAYRQAATVAAWHDELGTGCWTSARTRRLSRSPTGRHAPRELAEWRGIIYRHALKNALLPVVTVIGIEFRLPDRRTRGDRAGVQPERSRQALRRIRGQSRLHPSRRRWVMLVALVFIVTNFRH